MVQVVVFLASFGITQYFIIPLIDEHRIKKQHVKDLIEERKFHQDDLHRFADLPVKDEKNIGNSLFYAELGVTSKEQQMIIQSKVK